MTSDNVFTLPLIYLFWSRLHCLCICLSRAHVCHFQLMTFNVWVIFFFSTTFFFLLQSFILKLTIFHSLTLLYLCLDFRMHTKKGKSSNKRVKGGLWIKFCHFFLWLLLRNFSFKIAKFKYVENYRHWIDLVVAVCEI